MIRLIFLNARSRRFPQDDFMVDVTTWVRNSHRHETRGPHLNSSIGNQEPVAFFCWKDDGLSAHKNFCGAD